MVASTLLLDFDVQNFKYELEVAVVNTVVKRNEDLRLHPAVVPKIEQCCT